MACSDDVAVPLQTGGTSTPRAVVSVCWAGVGFAWGHERSGKARGRGTEVISPSLKSEPTPAVRTAIDAAFREPGEIKGRVQLRYDAVGNGQ